MYERVKPSVINFLNYQYWICFALAHYHKANQRKLYDTQGKKEI